MLDLSKAPRMSHPRLIAKLIAAAGIVASAGSLSLAQIRAEAAAVPAAFFTLVKKLKSELSA